MKAHNKEFLCILGYLYLQNKKAQKACSVFETLQAMDPRNLRVRYSLAYAYFLNENYEDALDKIDELLEGEGHADQYPSALFLKGSILWKLGQPEQARAMMNEYIERRKGEHERHRAESSVSSS